MNQSRQPVKPIAQVQKPAKTRLFFAIWPDDRVLRDLEKTCRALGIDQGRPVAPENFHITLLFLGEVDNDAIESLKRMAAGIKAEPCELVLDRLEHWVRPAVLCLVASQIPESLAMLVNELRKGARRLGFNPEKRPFRPHLTLARKVRRRVVGRDIEPVCWPVREIVLVKSERDPEGSRYTILARWPLGNRQQNMP